MHGWTVDVLIAPKILRWGGGGGGGFLSYPENYSGSAFKVNQCLQVSNIMRASSIFIPECGFEQRKLKILALCSAKNVHCMQFKTIQNP